MRIDGRTGGANRKLRLTQRLAATIFGGGVNALSAMSAAKGRRYAPWITCCVY